MPAVIFGFIEMDGTETLHCIIHPFIKTVLLVGSDEGEGEKPRFSIYD